ncbi:hypothetical protein GGI12_001146 [Dipsacomyces acuminosporus]|nr:hypothetical protein GGI12_001146 [Dipsacomyces acuminosporus]
MRQPLNRPTRLPASLFAGFRKLVRCHGHKYPTFCVIFDRTGRRMITGSDDYLIKIWCTRTGYLINTFKGHRDVITDIALNVENTLLASASSDGSVRIWNVKTGEPRGVLVANAHGRSKSITAVKFSPSPVDQIRFLATTCDDGLCRLYRWNKESLVFNTDPILIDGRPDTRDTVTSFAFNHTGSRFAIATKSGYISIYSTIAGAVNAPDGNNWGEPKLIKRLAAHEESITTLVFSGDGDMLLTGATDGTAKIWKCNSADLRWESVTVVIKEPLPAPSEVPPIALNSTNADPLPRTAVASTTSQMQQQTATAMPAAGIQQPQQPLANSAITVSASHAQQELPLDQQPAPAIQPPATQILEPLSNAASAAGENAPLETSNSGPVELASDNTAVLPTDPAEATMPATAGGEASAPATLTVKRVEANQVAWVCDSSRVLISNNVGTVFLVDPQTGRICWSHRAHSVAEVYVLIPHPTDPRIAVSGGYDGRAIVWNVEAGSVIREFKVGEQLFDGAFSEDGLSFAVASESGAVTLFGLGPAWAYEDANKMPEQMFASDYTAIIMDENHFVADQQTQIASYLVPHSALMDFDGRIYRSQKGSRFGLGIEMGVDTLRFAQEVLGRNAALQIELSLAYLDNRAAQDPIAETRPVRRRRRRGRPARSEVVEEMPEIELPIIIPVEDDSEDEEYTAGQEDEEEEEDEDEEEEDMLELARAEEYEDDGDNGTARGQAAGAWDRRSALELLRNRHHRTSPRSSRPGLRRSGRRTIDEDEDENGDSEEAVDGGNMGTSPSARRTRNARNDGQTEGSEAGENGLDGLDRPRLHHRAGRRGRPRLQPATGEAASSDDDFLPDSSTTSHRRQYTRRQPRRRGELHDTEAAGFEQGDSRPQTRNRRIASDSEDDMGNTAEADMDVDTDGDSGASSRDSVEGLPKTRSRRLRRGQDEYDGGEHSSDSAGPSPAPGQGLRLHPRSVRGRRPNRHEDTDSSFAEDALEDHSVAELNADSRNAQSRVPTSVDLVDTSDDLLGSDDASRPRWPRRQSQGQSQSLSKQQQHATKQAGRRKSSRNPGHAQPAVPSSSNLVDHTYSPTDWVLATAPSAVPYRPQVGDVIAYFREGHEDFWSNAYRCRKLSDKLLPYVAVPNLPVVVFGQVASISYAVGPPTYCTVKIQLLRHQTIEELDSEDALHPELNRRYIHVQYHDCDGVPDFLILYSHYRASLRRPLSCGDSVRVLFDEDQIHDAVIVGFRGIKASSRQSSVTKQIARNPWKSIIVKWTGDGGNSDGAMESGTDAESKVEQVSAWELAHDDVCVDAQIAEDTRNALQEIVDSLRSSAEFVWFVKNVDYEVEYPDYLLNIAYPMCLGTIYERLDSGFYRHTSAVMFDMALIQENADTFNDPGTPVPLAAQQLVASYKRLLDQALGSSENGQHAPEPADTSRRQPSRLRRASSSIQRLDIVEPQPPTRLRKRRIEPSRRSERRTSRRRIDNDSDGSFSDMNAQSSDYEDQQEEEEEDAYEEDDDEFE